jgi:hypothetical protein
MLEENNWNIEISVDRFFNNPPSNAYDFPSETASVSVSNIEQLFSMYSGTHPQCFFPSFQEVDANFSYLIKTTGKSSTNLECKDL